MVQQMIIKIALGILGVAVMWGIQFLLIFGLKREPIDDKEAD